MLGPVRKKSLNAIAHGVLDALDIEIDSLNIDPTIKDFLHNVVEAGDKTVKTALSDKKLLKEPITNIVQTEHDGEMVEQPTPENVASTPELAQPDERRVTDGF